MTDGINDPPPSARATAGVSLENVAKPFCKMPWFVWQIQLGKEIDREVDAALGCMPRYASAKAGKREALLGLVDRIKSEATKRVKVRADLATAELGAVQEGGRRTTEIVFAVEPGTGIGTGRIRLRGETGASDVRASVTPETVTLEGGRAVAQLTVEPARDAAVGEVRGLVVAEVVEGPLEMVASHLPWGVQVVARSRAVRLEPQTLAFGTLAPGTSKSLAVKVAAEPGQAVGALRLNASAAKPGLSVQVEPAEVPITESGGAEVRVTVVVAADAPAAPSRAS